MVRKFIERASDEEIAALTRRAFEEVRTGRVRDDRYRSTAQCDRVLLPRPDGWGAQHRLGQVLLSVRSGHSVSIAFAFDSGQGCPGRKGASRSP